MIKLTKQIKKIPDISGLATKTELTVVKNKILDVTGFVKQIMLLKLVR